MGSLEIMEEERGLKMRKVSITIMAGMFGLLLVNVHQAQAFDEKAGNALWGKYAIQTCRVCHKEKGLSSLMPEEKSSAEWDSYFTDKYKRLRDTKHDFSVIGINERQLENIHRYLVEDSTKKEGAGDDEEQAVTSPKTIEAIPVKKGATQVEVNKAEKAEPVKGDIPVPVPVPVPDGGAAFNMAAGDPTKGRNVFRKCLTCHKKNNGPVISPADRTIAAWDRFFVGDYKKFKRAMPQFDTYGYTVEQMQNLHKFVTQYALDAAKPKTCE
jgi:cytochrome c2